MNAIKRFAQYFGLRTPELTDEEILQRFKDHLDSFNPSVEVGGKEYPVSEVFPIIDYTHYLSELAEFTAKARAPKCGCGGCNCEEVS